MGLLGIFKKKNKNMKQSSHIVHFTVPISSQIRQRIDESIFLDKHSIYKLIT